MFSPKQRTVLTWWRPGSPYADRQAIICDGAVRSGKTLCTGLSFFCWAMSSFHERSFALCGKTITSVRRNLLQELLPMLEKQNISLYATALREDTLDIRDADLKRSAVVIGSEGRGVSDAVLDCCEQTIKIPMRERCESLNAAMAAGIVLWESWR